MADMKKSFWKLMIVAVSMMAACCQKPSDGNFTVTGEITNVEDDYLILFFKSNLDCSTTTIAVDGRVMDLMIPRNYTIPFPEGRTCNYIPMETYLDQAMDVNDEIPIFSVTGGICGAMDFMGTPMFTQDYCGLRDKHQHPKEWVNNAKSRK